MVSLIITGLFEEMLSQKTGHVISQLQETNQRIRVLETWETSCDLFDRVVSNWIFIMPSAAPSGSPLDQHTATQVDTHVELFSRT